jgi:hypothetical protein
VHRAGEEGDHQEAVRQLSPLGLRQECHDYLTAEEPDELAFSCSCKPVELARFKPSPKGDCERENRQEEDHSQGREDFR